MCFRIQNHLKKLQNPSNELQLDGNGQLFLCLQDLCMKNFLSELKKEHQNPDRKRAMVIITDEEWDLNELQSAFENDVERTYLGKDIKASRESVMKKTHEVSHF